MSIAIPPTEARPRSAVLGVAFGGLGAEAKIDLCRGLFAILVVVAHALEFAASIHPGSAAEMPEAAAPICQHTLGTGFYWVMGFFVLSGYCIQASVERSSGRRFSLGEYSLARLTRILPLYFVALLFAALVEGMIPSPLRLTNWGRGIDGWTFLGQVAGAQGLSGTFGSFAPSWSITYELFYYAMYGLLAATFLTRTRLSAWAGLATCVGLGGFLLAVYLRSPGKGLILALGQLFGLGVNWFLGALVAAYREPLSRSRLARVGSRAWPLVLAAAMAARYDGRLRLEWIYLSCGAAFALMLVRFEAADAESGRARRAIPGAIHKLGLASYPTYLFHGPLMVLMGAILLAFGAPGGWRTTWLLLSVAPIAVGIALGVLVEAPFLSLRADWLARRRARAEVSS